MSEEKTSEKTQSRERIFRLDVFVAGSVGGLVVSLLMGLTAGIAYKVHEQQERKRITNTPVKVRGGAMRIRTDPGLGQWLPETGGYCLAFAPTNIALNEFVPRISGSPISLPTSGVPWTLVMYGSDPTKPALSPSNNGLKLEANTSPCNGHTASNYAMHVTLVNNAAIYPTIRTEVGGATSLRFEDTTPGVGGTPSICSGPNGNPQGDEDGCERLSQVVVTIGAQQLGAYDCNEQAKGCQIDLGP